MHPTNQQFVDSASRLVAVLENDIRAAKAANPSAPFAYPTRCAHGVQNAMHQLGTIISDAPKGEFVKGLTIGDDGMAHVRG